jgi:cytochrome c-type biogenesis protein CcmH/NrfG
VNSPFIWLRIGAISAMAVALCHCSSPAVDQAWAHYDPVSPPPDPVLARLDEEAAKLQEKLSSQPENRRSLIRLADIRFLQGRETQATELYGRALAIAGHRIPVESRARYGTALLHAERNAEARDVLEEVLSEAPKNGRALLSYAEYQATIAGNLPYARTLLARAKESGDIAIPEDFEQALAGNLN